MIEGTVGIKLNRVATVFAINKTIKQIQNEFYTCDP